MMMRRATGRSESNASSDHSPSLTVPLERRSRLRRRKKGSKSARKGQQLLLLLRVPAIIVILLFAAAFVLLWKRSPNKWKEIHVRRPPVSVTAPFTPLYPKISRDRETSSQLSKEAVEMCTQTLWHTLETTTIVLPDGETFIHTGDIDDLWLRDSAAQIHPLLIPVHNGTALIQNDRKLDRIVSGLIKRIAMYIRHDPYANAFRIVSTYCDLII